MLLQKIEGKERVIAYASRVLNEHEIKYNTSEKECLAIFWSVTKKFRCYVEGTHFKVITDHEALKRLINLKNPNGRLARWSLVIQGYDFDVEHRKGAYHVVPDALSRAHEDLVKISTVEISGKVEDDWYIQHVKDIQINPEKFKDYKIVNGLLYYYRPDPRTAVVREEETDWKLVVTKENREQVLKECHKEHGGHLGIKKSYYRAFELYYWPGMNRDMAKYARHVIYANK